MPVRIQDKVAPQRAVALIPGERLRKAQELKLLAEIEDAFDQILRLISNGYLRGSINIATEQVVIGRHSAKELRELLEGGG